MSVKDLREAFTAALAGAGICTRATLSYIRIDGTEWQSCDFGGSYADGTPFSVKAEPVPARGSVILAAQETARALLQRKAPT